jgi:hypothetical protein
MYQTNRLNFSHELAATPPHMPIDTLLALPDYVTGPENVSYLFNLPGAINDLMGGSGWEKAVQVMRPYIWAPQWSDEELYKFVSAPFGRDKHRFPKIPPSGLRPTRREFEIVHFVGSLMMDEDVPALDIGCGGNPPALTVTDVMRELDLAKTRLLILQNPAFLQTMAPDEYRRIAARLAESIISAGGPPVLVIAGAERPELMNSYLLDFFANIIHNWSLSVAAQPKAEIDASVWVELFVGSDGDEILQISRLRDELYGKIETIRRSVNPMAERNLRSRFNYMKPYLHQSQVKALESEAHETRAFELDEDLKEGASRILDSMSKMRMDLDYSHESGAAIPLGESSKAMAAVEEESSRLETLYPAVAEMETALEEQAAKAPRVLNAGFADPLKGKVLEPDSPLVAGQEYDLLIDVGPKWSKVKSIVTGNEIFPEAALPPDETGYPIHVVFISDDLVSGSDNAERKLFSDWIWIPRHTGRSFPYNLAEQKKGETSGPIAFRFKAPELSVDGADTTQLHGRLCLYYMNNLIQSARVQATVARTPDVVLEVTNVIDVDYVLSGTVQDLERLATRAVSFTSDDPLGVQAISLNLTLNDDGKAHRVLVRGIHEPPTSAPANNSPVGWTPFDPAAARDALDKAREDLKACFYERDAMGNPVLDSAGEPKIWENKNGKGKTRTQFKWDLFKLAQLGNSLFNKAFGDVRPEGNWATNAQWMRALQKRLESSSIIQVSRTGPANYVFPWGLIYQYPLPGPGDQIKFCKVVNEEWAESGVRQKPQATCCPYTNESFHVKNVICPYGFWGLNHIIEQPVSALRQLTNGSYVHQNATDEIIMREANLDLSVVVTHDVAQAELNAHLGRLGLIKPMRIHPPNPADDTDKVRELLKGATVVYFLCHGEHDGKNPYLSIGVRDEKDIHRIYPETLQGWARTPDLVSWETHHPLIFINGCHTANLRPGEVLNFVTAFGLAGAGGIIGTEVSVLAPVAMQISELVFEKMLKGNMSVGQAMYQTRWELANEGNLLGLAYTLYCLANLHISKN